MAEVVKETKTEKTDVEVLNSQYDTLRADYEKLVKAFNKLLKEYNEMHVNQLFVEK